MSDMLYLISLWPARLGLPRFIFWLAQKDFAHHIPLEVCRSSACPALLKVMKLASRPEVYGMDRRSQFD